MRRGEGLLRFGWLICLVLIWAPAAFAQDSADGQPVGEISTEAPSDSDVEARIGGIFSEIEALGGVAPSVSQGVVVLKGSVPNEAAAERATRIASRFSGVVSVEDQMDRTLDVRSNVEPVLADLRHDLQQFIRGLPLFGVAVLVFAIIYLIGHLIGGFSALWRRLTPNLFLADLAAQMIRITAFVVALVTALNLVGAAALTGAILGGAGVVGLAVGFAVKDTIENYIASIMLSIRQPFRAQDYVVVNDREGIVIRLNSRATILMTLDGNHLRIPNSDVFKAIILNYTRNPERRFDFDLGVDSEDDPIAAMQVGLDAMRALDFVLADPAPSALIKTVGDSNIILTFYGWVNQSQTDFPKARSLGIRAVKQAIEAHGFTLPEPIYRLRFDNGPLLESETPPTAAPPTPKPASAPVDEYLLDTSPAKTIEEKVAEERQADDHSTEGDLLDDNRPVE